MADDFRWGLIGPGRIAHRFAGGLEVIDDARLYAVASTRQERAEAFAAQYAAEKIYTSYEALAGDPNVDAIYVATPHNFHFENALLCLEAGKPVLCEKPLTVNAAQARRLIETAREKRVFLMEALWTRYLPVYGMVRRWLDEGAIGQVEYFTATFGFRQSRDESERWLNPALAGGVLLDMGVYPIAVAQFVFRQNPAAFQVAGRVGPTGVDEFVALTLQYDSGAVAQISSNFLTNNANDCWIYGSQGNIHIPTPFWVPSQATLENQHGAQTVELPPRGTGFEYEIEEVARCVRQGLLESPTMTHADTLANMTLMDQARAEIGVKYPFE